MTELKPCPFCKGEDERRALRALGTIAFYCALVLLELVIFGPMWL